ncbi:MAG: DNA polymerase III subunit beta [Anaerovoracaceae bacterium]
MKFTVGTEAFKCAMERAYKCVDKRSAVSSLQNLLFHVEKNNSYVVGTNLDNWVISYITVDNASEETDIVFEDTASLLKAMKFFKGYDISFDVQEYKTIICCDGKQTSQTLLDVEDFPKIPIIDMAEGQSYKYDIEKLKERFNLIKYATGDKNVKELLTGIHFDGNAILALDGHRMAMDTSTELDIAVPFTARLNGLALATDVLHGDINIMVNDTKISMSDGHTTVISSLLVGEYIDYRKVIPNNGKETKLQIAEYSEALKYFKAFKKSKDCRQIVGWLNDNLILLTEDNVYTNNRCKLSAFKGEFKDAIGFNNQYMLDAMTQFKTENVIVSIASSVSPIVIIDDNGGLALVLPVSLPLGISKHMRELD